MSKATTIIQRLTCSQTIDKQWRIFSAAHVFNVTKLYPKIICVLSFLMQTIHNQQISKSRVAVQDTDVV